MRIFVEEEYEKCLLGCMLVDNTIIDLVSSKIKQEQFYIQKNAKIFAIIVNEYIKNKLCDIITLSLKLPKESAYIASLTNLVPTATNWEFYVEQVKKYYLARELQKELSNRLSDLTVENVIDTIHSVDSELTSFMNHENGKASAIQELVSQLVDDVDKISKFDKQYLGEDCGWTNLNDILDGVELGKLMIIGARPSIGKTAFGLQLASNLCKNNVPACIFSLEMSAKSLMTRLAACKSKIPRNYITHGFVSKSINLLQKLQRALSEIYEYPLTIYDKNIENEKDLISQIRVEAKTKGTKIFFVDHLGLIKHSDRTMKRFEQVHDITSKLHKLAQELNITIICLCQLKRDAEGKKPTLSDLRESGDIEQNADIIMFIHRNRDAGGESEIPTEIIVLKNRDGSCGTAKMIFHPKTTYFEEIKDNSIQ